MGLSQNGMGPAIVTWEALRAWQAQVGVALDPWEARLMVRLGHVRAVAMQEKTPPPGGKKQNG